MGLNDVLQVIQEATGFRDRAAFATPDEVVAFFTPDNQLALHGEAAITDAETLRFWADVILGTGEHCTFAGKGFDDGAAPEERGREKWDGYRFPVPFTTGASEGH